MAITSICLKKKILNMKNAHTDLVSMEYGNKEPGVVFGYPHSLTIALGE